MKEYSFRLELEGRKERAVLRTAEENERFWRATAGMWGGGPVAGGPTPPARTAAAAAIEVTRVRARIRAWSLWAEMLAMGMVPDVNSGRWAANLGLTREETQGFDQVAVAAKRILGPLYSEALGCGWVDFQDKPPVKRLSEVTESVAELDEMTRRAWSSA